MVLVQLHVVNNVVEGLAQFMLCGQLITQPSKYLCIYLKCIFHFIGIFDCVIIFSLFIIQRPPRTCNTAM